MNSGVDRLLEANQMIYSFHIEYELHQSIWPDDLNTFKYEEKNILKLHNRNIAISHVYTSLVRYFLVLDMPQILINISTRENDSAHDQKAVSNFV